jgi:hypothetical protein
MATTNGSPMTYRRIYAAEAQRAIRNAAPGPWRDGEDCDYRADGTPVAWRMIEVTPIAGHARQTLAHLGWDAPHDALLMSMAPDLAATVVEMDGEIATLRAQIADMEAAMSLKTRISNAATVAQ